MPGPGKPARADISPGSPDTARTVHPRVVTSAELLAGGRELVIRHGADFYRLLITSQNKLILTK